MSYVETDLAFNYGAGAQCILSSVRHLLAHRDAWVVFLYMEGLSKDMMKCVVLVIVVVGVVILGVVDVLRKGAPRPVAAQPPAMPPPPAAVTNAPAVSNPAPVSVVPPLTVKPAEKLPKGWAGVPSQGVCP